MDVGYKALEFQSRRNELGVKIHHGSEAVKLHNRNRDPTHEPVQSAIFSNEAWNKDGTAGGLFLIASRSLEEIILYN